MFLSNRAIGIAPSPTLAITAKAKQMQSEGLDIISFGAGEPDFDTPDFIKDAAIKSLKSGFTKYTPVGGTLNLKKAIVNKLKRDNNLEYKPNEILVSLGAKHSIFNAILATINDGDEVIIPTPYWVSYPEIVKMAGGIPVYISASEDTNFCVTAQQIKAAITPKTKMLILNSPSNPTGGTYTKEMIAEIAKVIVDANILVLSDEIYEKILYGNAKHVSIASLGEDIKKLTITINGHSKAYSMTGWRLGYAAASADIIGAMNNIQGHSTSNPVSFTQLAAEVALNADQGFLTEMVAAFDQRRKYIVAALNAIEGIYCPDPQGAFYVFPNVSKLYGKSINGKKINSSDNFCDFLLEDAKVAVVAGSGFGADNYVRLSYATDINSIEKGIARIAESVSKLK